MFLNLEILNIGNIAANCHFPFQEQRSTKTYQDKENTVKRARLANLAMRCSAAFCNNDAFCNNLHIF